jgi:hypothetical protein
MMGRAQDFARGLAHPIPAFFHVVFKAGAIGAYMFGSLFSSSFVNIFILCVLLLAFDFWTVKNVTGRLMVGLRWNSVVKEDGSTSWKFEAQEEGLSSTSLDIAVFWVGLFTPGVVWVLFGVRARPPAPRVPASPSSPALARLALLARLARFWLCFLPLPSARPALIARLSLSRNAPLAPSQMGCFFSFKFDWLLLIIAAISMSWANIIGYVRCKQDVRSRIGAGVAGLVARSGMNAQMGAVVQSAAGSAFGFS